MVAKDKKKISKLLKKNFIHIGIIKKKSALFGQNIDGYIKTVSYLYLYLFICIVLNLAC